MGFGEAEFGDVGGHRRKMPIIKWWHSMILMFILSSWQSDTISIHRSKEILHSHKSLCLLAACIPYFSFQVDDHSSPFRQFDAVATVISCFEKWKLNINGQAFSSLPAVIDLTVVSLLPVNNWYSLNFGTSPRNTKLECSCHFRYYWRTSSGNR